ncbi:uncharacterized protein LOC143436019 [Arvicanthis niloticus]|uniref:uncharacterized protein LOC143310087 n=1 Tax=Arvicanthis niloticus TaxID=61156 RepID=UPI00402B24F5
MGVNVVHWFQKGLRLHDNPALKECIQGADTIRCVYILNPWFTGSSSVGINRWRIDMHSVWYQTSLFHPSGEKASCSQNTPSNMGNMEETEHGLSSCPSVRTCSPGHYELPRSQASPLVSEDIKDRNYMFSEWFCPRADSNRYRHIIYGWCLVTFIEE